MHKELVRSEGVSEGYQNFIKSQDRLFRPAQEAYWTPEFETPIVKIHLSNDIPVYFYLEDRLDWGLGFTLKYPIGSHEDPASHLIEHMCVHPTGIKNFREKTRASDLTYDASTAPTETVYSLGIARHQLVLAHQTKIGQVFEDLANLLLGMTVFPEITDENIALEKARMASEFAGRRDDYGTRMWDYILPLITLDRRFCSPNFLEETNFTAQQLLERHQIRPHAGIKIWAGGNPRIESGFEGIKEALEKTFGQIQSNRELPFAKKEPPKIFSQFGNSIKIIPSHPVKDHSIGMISVFDLNETKKAVEADTNFSRTLTTAPYSLLAQEGLAYGSFSSSKIYDSSGVELFYDGVTTINPDKAFEFMKQMVEQFLSQTKNSPFDFESCFTKQKIDRLNGMFFEPNFNRIELAEKYGLSIAQNAKALYDFIQNIQFEDAVKAGNKIFRENRVGFFHYGTGKALPGFNEVSEEELEKIWLTT